MDSIETLQAYKRYKDDKKVQNLLAKKQAELKKRQLSLEAKKQEAIEKAKEAISIRYEKQLAKIAKSKQRELNKQIRKVVNLKPNKPKKKSDAKMKQNAYQEFQKYSKLSRMDKDGYVILVDTGERVYWRDCDWWHYRPKHNYPQLAFELDNVRPISKWTNKMQGDNVGIRWYDGMYDMVWAERYQELSSIADDKREKNRCVKRDRNFYNDIYQDYKQRNTALLAKLDNV